MTSFETDVICPGCKQKITCTIRDDGWDSECGGEGEGGCPTWIDGDLACTEAHTHAVAAVEARTNWGLWDGYNLCWDTTGVTHTKASALKAQREQAGHDAEQFTVIATCPVHPDQWADDCETCWAEDRKANESPSRVYSVGLPVWLTVYDDGRVEMEIDTTEAASAIWENPGLDGTDREPDENTVAADQERIDAWHRTRGK